jgi:hypothetical protein
LVAWSLLVVAFLCANAYGQVITVAHAEEPPPVEEPPSTEESPPAEEPPGEEGKVETTEEKQLGALEAILREVRTTQEVEIEQRATLEEIRSEVPSELQALHRDLGSEGAIGEALQTNVVSELQLIEAALGGEGVLAEHLAAIQASSAGEGAPAGELAPLVNAVDAAGEATREALWWIAGALVFSLAAFAFLRLFGFLDWGTS